MEFITHARYGENVGTTERWFSIVGGSALAALGLWRRRPLGWAAAAIGVEMVRRGATGHCPLYTALGISTASRGQGSETTSVPYELGIRVDRAVTVNMPREAVYRFWRNLENLPRFMRHLESVRTEGDRSHWVATAPAGRTVQWDAVIHNEIPNELIAWRSLPGADVDNAGAVRFKDAPGGRGTEVHVELQYNPPAGPVGALVAKLWGEEPSQQIQDDLHRFKQILEAGEIPTTQGQPSGREMKMAATKKAEQGEKAQHASELSFPASDPPSYSQVK